MADDYRKPASPTTSSNRGTVVRQPDAPSSAQPIATGADPRNKARFAREAALAAEELEIARRRGSLTARLVGLGLLGFFVLMTFMHRSEFVEGGYVHLGARANVVFGTSLSLGLWMLVLGSGNAPSMREAPEWWRIGAAVATVLGVGAFVSGTGTLVIEALLALTT